MIRGGSKNGDQKNMSLKELGLRAQKLLTCLGSIINKIAGNRMITL